jgi:hypothetical protein
LLLTGRSHAIARWACFGITLLASTTLFGGTAHAFCRSTTEAVSPSFNPASEGCFTKGQLLFWQSTCVGYSIFRGGSASVPFEEAKRVIDESFATWTGSRCGASGAPPGITFQSLGAVDCVDVRYNPDAVNENLIILRDEGWPYPFGTLALTTVSFDPETGAILDADMEINASQRNLSTSPAATPGAYDLASIVTHEVGHFAGLAHSTDRAATMFASYGPGAITLRSLTDDDVAGLCAIYPTAASRVVSARPVPTCTWCLQPAPGQTETIPATRCEPAPSGQRPVCNATTVPNGACSTGAVTHGQGIVALLSSLAAAAAPILRSLRRRRARGHA